jgi:catechol 2,3-dioxygenase-like lactoylglutathione lyase family enzyme
MRLDHIAYRVSDRKKTSKFFIDAFGYTVQTEFDLVFDDKSTANCIALKSPEWLATVPHVHKYIDGVIDYHMAPELFISDGSPDSIVGQWVAERGSIGGIHHLAYEVNDVQSTMDEWTNNGWAEFASDKPLHCPGLTQVFTKPLDLTGVIYEFIKRDGAYGFCKDNVKRLMLSTESRV